MSKFIILDMKNPLPTLSQTLSLCITSKLFISTGAHAVLCHCQSVYPQPNQIWNLQNSFVNICSFFFFITVHVIFQWFAFSFISSCLTILTWVPSMDSKMQSIRFKSTFWLKIPFSQYIIMIWSTIMLPHFHLSEGNDRGLSCSSPRSGLCIITGWIILILLLTSGGSMQISIGFILNAWMMCFRVWIHPFTSQTYPPCIFEGGLLWWL